MKRGFDFPNEGFVQLALKRHFELLGFIEESHRNVDFICAHPDTGIRWHIEAKGMSQSVNTDLNTGIGQLIQAMRCHDCNYGIALPDIEPFRTRVAHFDPKVLAKLNLHWLWVTADGTVKIDPPTN